MTLDERIAAALERQAQVLEKLERRLASDAGDTLSEAETLAELGCKRRKLFLLVAEGAVVAVRVGRQNRYTRDSIRAYRAMLASRRNVGG